MSRSIFGWFLTVVGVLWGIYGGGQFLVGVVRAISEPERTAPLVLALTGALIFGLGALVAWGGRRLRRSAFTNALLPVARNVFDVEKWPFRLVFEEDAAGGVRAFRCEGPRLSWGRHAAVFTRLAA